MSELARAFLDEEAGHFCVETTTGERRGGLSKGEAASLAQAINTGALKAAQLFEVAPRAYLESGQSSNWDNSAPPGTPAQKG